MIDRFGLLPEPARNLFTVTRLKLKATPMGVRKIEAGPKGGRIRFEEQPRLDPAHLIGLIQSRPAEYRLDGSTTLRFTLDLEDPQARLTAMEHLLGLLSGEDARTRLH
jgi:transcription-repair coupling factor (superfamily II helicase)